MRHLILLIWLLTACSGAGGDHGSGDGDGGFNLGLEGVSAVHVVSLAGWGSQERPVPDTVRTEAGSAVVFQVADFRVHSVEFLAEELTPAQSVAIQENAQLLSPPLVERGSRYVVTFHGAPPGVYPYRIRGLGQPARGAVIIGPGEPEP